MVSALNKLKNAGTVFASLSGVFLYATPPKQNVVFILVDDFGWADVSYNGSKFYETPNIDRLKAEGMQFTNGYAAAAISSPTRCSILTGKYPARLQITDWIPGFQHNLNKQQLSKYRMIAPTFVHNMPLEEKTIAEALKENGYKTCFVGKWHCAEDSAYFPQHQGFDKNIGGFWSGSPKGNANEGKAYYTPYNNPYLPDGSEGEFLTDRLGNESAKWIEQQKNQPFLLYLSFYAVHTPIQPKPEYAAYFREKAKKMGIDQLTQFTNNHNWIRNNRFALPHWKERTIQSNADYAALIKSMDENVGKVLDKLLELGLDKNTMVCFTSDNGGLSTAEGSPTSNAPLRYGKGWLYEGGIREPYLIKAPGLTKAGSVCQIPVTSTDFYPTILDACGLKLQPAQHCDGVSLIPLLKGEKNLKRKAIFWHYPHYGGKGDAPCAAVRMGDWKLIEFFEDNHVELYNLKTDISEKTDESAKYPKRVKMLQNQLHKWQKSVNALMPVFNPDYRNVVV
jgi:arylsulfatase A-like enzyme